MKLMAVSVSDFESIPEQILLRSGNWISGVSFCWKRQQRRAWIQRAILSHWDRWLLTLFAIGFAIQRGRRGDRRVILSIPASRPAGSFAMDCHLSSSCLLLPDPPPPSLPIDLARAADAVSAVAPLLRRVRPASRQHELRVRRRRLSSNWQQSI